MLRKGSWVIVWHEGKQHAVHLLLGTYQQRCVWKYPGRSMSTQGKKQCRGRNWEEVRLAKRKPGLYMCTKSRIEVKKTEWFYFALLANLKNVIWK